MLPSNNTKGKETIRGPCSNFFVLATTQIQQRDMMLLRLLELATRSCVAQTAKASSQDCSGSQCTWQTLLRRAFSQAEVSSSKTSLFPK